ncbi:NYN domain-containing protein [Faucicola boevrei]|uniref:NYN domain-containing protein n=1 Tax=Faucicola boevrei TaxID=346665 RepID=UPI000590B266|nr:NYN domain-containing protein [Moraxella boevrei]
MPQEIRLAVLIDADNASVNHLDKLLSEIATLGKASVRRAYGDWTRPQLNSWKNVLLSHSIQPIQQFSYTTGKNATDASLIIDAMDLLYTERFEGFCLVSSDSDFTRLAQRIREQGLLVYGFGRSNTPKPFVQACDRFTYLEFFDDEKRPTVDFYDSADMLFSIDRNQMKPVDVAITLVRVAIANMANDQGWANIAPVKNYILKVEPDFDARLFNFDKFSDFLRAYPRYFELQERFPNDKNHKVVFVRNRNLAEVPSDTNQD